MNTTIQKALQGASAILKGQQATVTVAEIQAAMVAMGELRKQAGETAAAAFARLVAARDPELELLAKAADQLRCAGTSRAEIKKQVEPFIADANKQVDEIVAMHQREGEDTPTTTARLARDREPLFMKAWARLRSVQDHAN
ncbi:MAG: hypothetical protein H6838_16300 [Planctomycetes bacterium]|nr:hypothetical protein [Planctomycetota bacterium]MCB9887054.1 hypothetical protein [Planctomycetota bacterium]